MSTKSLQFFGRVEGGKLILTNRKAFEQEIQHMPNKDVTIVIKAKNTRSDQQNRYYWGVVVWTIRQHLIDMGYRYSAEDIHAALKEKFNSQAVVNEHGEVVVSIGQSTSSLNKDEFAEYLDKVLQWASETLGCYIPSPNSDNELFMM